MKNPAAPDSPTAPGAPQAVDAAALNRRLALVQAGCLAVIAGAALVAFQTATPGLDAAPAREWTVAGVVLALAAVSLRRFSTSPVMQGGTRVVLGVLSLVLAAGVALCGLAIAWNGGPLQPALAFALGACLLALRRPSIALPSAGSH